MQAFALTETYQLLQAIEQIDQPTTFLQSVFFSDKEVTMQDVLAVEFIKKHRRLAPMLVKGAGALNMSREKSTVKLWRPPLIGSRRTIGLQDISKRIIGEMPVISTMTPEERALKMQADDLKDLLNMLVNRREAMAASLLTTGTIPIRGFADDGTLAEEETLILDEDWVVSVQTPWSDEAATIYDDLKAAVDYIAEETGVLADVAICGRNIEGYLLKNLQFKEFAKYFRESLAMMSLEPKFQSPNARRLGTISSLGLEVYSYLGSYVDDVSGTTKRYISDDMIIIGSSKSGKGVFGRVDLMKDGQFLSYSSEAVPQYTFNNDNQTTSLSVYSRYLPILEVVDSVRCLKVVD
ncbi:MAG: major capsid protein [Quinella sp. 1Q5]|nr:major capsid protein [Quinella sp. 1Q5]